MGTPRMVSQRPFRFGLCAWDAATLKGWEDKARKAEDLGFSTLLIGDHVVGEGLAPLPALVTAAHATKSLRMGTFVAGNDFRHPLVLAREAATVDLLSEGRFELGLGAGWDLDDYGKTGIRWDTPSVRVDRLTESVQVIKGYLEGHRANFQGTHYSITDVEPFPNQASAHACPYLSEEEGSAFSS